MKKNNSLAILLLAGSLGLGFAAFAEETVSEKVQTMGNKTADAAKRTWRNAKDEVCEMVNGKVKCLAKKVVNGAKNAADSIDTKATETKNKVD